MKYKQLLFLLVLMCMAAYAVKRKAPELAPEIPKITVTLWKIDNHTDDEVTLYSLLDENLYHVNLGTTMLNRPLQFRRVNAQTIRTYPWYISPINRNEDEIVNQVLMLSIEITRHPNPQNANTEIVAVTAGLLIMDITQQPPVAIGIVDAVEIPAFIVNKDAITDFKIELILNGEDLEQSGVVIDRHIYGNNIIPGNA